MTVLRDLIGGAIDAIAGSYPIKTAGRVFNPPNNGKYFELVPIQDRNSNETWGQEKISSGDIRIILHWPIDENAGIYEPVEILEILALKFPKGGKIGTLPITENPRILDHIDGETDLLFPLVVRYQVYHKAP